jgi:hypothetical protein
MSDRQLLKSTNFEFYYAPHHVKELIVPPRTVSTRSQNNFQETFLLNDYTYSSSRPVTAVKAA